MCLPRKRAITARAQAAGLSRWYWLGQSTSGLAPTPPGSPLHRDARSRACGVKRAVRRSGTLPELPSRHTSFVSACGCWNSIGSMVAASRRRLRRPISAVSVRPMKRALDSVDDELRFRMRRARSRAAAPARYCLCGRGYAPPLFCPGARRPHRRLLRHPPMRASSPRFRLHPCSPRTR